MMNMGKHRYVDSDVGQRKVIILERVLEEHIGLDPQ